MKLPFFVEHVLRRMASTLHILLGNSTQPKSLLSQDRHSSSHVHPLHCRGPLCQQGRLELWPALLVMAGLLAAGACASLAACAAWGRAPPGLAPARALLWQWALPAACLLMLTPLLQARMCRSSSGCGQSAVFLKPQAASAGAVRHARMR